MHAQDGCWRQHLIRCLSGLVTDGLYVRAASALVNFCPRPDPDDQYGGQKEAQPKDGMRHHTAQASLGWLGGVIGACARHSCFIALQGSEELVQ